MSQKYVKIRVNDDQEIFFQMINETIDEFNHEQELKQ